jgi:hypothetical protein
MASSRSQFAWRIVILFIAGAIGGTLGDLCHVLSGIESYPALWPYVPGTPLPYWVPIEFGFAAAWLGFTHEVFPVQLPTPRGARFRIDVLGSVVLFQLAWALSGFLPLTTGGSKDIALALMALGGWYFFDRRPFVWVMALLTAIGGVIVEALLINRGFFNYRSGDSNLFGVPSWLPWIYMLACFAIGNLSAWMRRRG